MICRKFGACCFVGYIVVSQLWTPILEFPKDIYC